MTWDDCDLVESVPGVVAGKPLIKGTRVEPDTILIDYQMGSPIEEIHENFPSVSIETIRQILTHAHCLQAAH